MTMNFKFTATLVFMFMILVFCLKPKALSDLPDVYVALDDTYVIVDPSEVKTVVADRWYKDSDDLKVLIDFQRDNNTNGLQYFYDKMLKSNKIIFVNLGNTPVIYLEEYKGYYIFKVDR